VRAWSWSPGVSGRDSSAETTGSPKFLGNLDCPFAHVLRRRQDCLRQTCTATAAWPLGENKGSHDLGLSTLNSMAFGLAVYASQGGLPHHHARLASGAGQALPDGLSTRKIPMKGFKICILTSHPPSPKLCLAQSDSPGAECLQPRFKLKLLGFVGFANSNRNLNRQRTAWFGVRH
jgi:hypothetical protein